MKEQRSELGAASELGCKLLEKGFEGLRLVPARVFVCSCKIS